MTPCIYILIPCIYHVCTMYMYHTLWCHYYATDKLHFKKLRDRWIFILTGRIIESAQRTSCIGMTATFPGNIRLAASGWRMHNLFPKLILEFIQTLTRTSTGGQSTFGFSRNLHGSTCPPNAANSAGLQTQTNRWKRKCETTSVRYLCTLNRLWRIWHVFCTCEMQSWNLSRTFAMSETTSNGWIY